MKHALRGLAAGVLVGLTLEVIQATTPADFGADVPAWPIWLGGVGLLLGALFALASRLRS